MCTVFGSKALSIAAVVVLVAFGARFDTVQLTPQVAFQGLAYASGRACDRLNVVLLEKTYRAAAHTAGQHDIGSLAMDEAGHLARGMVAVIGIVNCRNGFDFLAFNVNQDETHAPSEMGTDGAVQTVPVVC
jgi:hypothetical protein